MRETDELGLLLEGSILTVYLPAYGTALPFHIKARTNKGYEVFHYGPLPLKANEVLPTYDGGSATVPGDGILPARAYTDLAKTFPYSGVYDESDMWYFPSEYNDMLFHVIQKVTPSFLRCDIQIPKGVKPARFQRDKVIGGVDKDFGFSRGVIETIHLPEIHYGYRWGNDTNIALVTKVTFIYAEYVVETVKDAETIFAILTKKIPSHWISLPIPVKDASITRALTLAYGITGYPIYPTYKKTQAINEYTQLLGSVKV